MPPPKKVRLSDIDKEDRVLARDAVGDSGPNDPRPTPGMDGLVPYTGKKGGTSALAPYPDVPVPTLKDTETAEAATDWAEQEILKATPRAVQEVLHQMKSSPEAKQRLTAALQILDRAGVKEKEKGPTVMAPVFVLTADAIASIPWAKKANAQGKIVDGQLVGGSKELINASKKDGPRES